MAHTPDIRDPADMTYLEQLESKYWTLKRRIYVRIMEALFEAPDEILLIMAQSALGEDDSICQHFDEVCENRDLAILKEWEREDAAQTRAEPGAEAGTGKGSPKERAVAGTPAKKPLTVVVRRGKGNRRKEAKAGAQGSRK